jgi:hypothetical protein
LKPTLTEEPATLKPLVVRRSELMAEIAGIERGASDSNLEDSAHQLANRNAQLHLVELQIKGLQDAHSKAVELARRERAQALDSVGSEARGVLAEVAASFLGQHREHLQDVINQYATPRTAETRNVMGLLPWFLQYERNIRRFCDGGADPARLLQFLGDALGGVDFLMPPSS